MAKVNNSEEHLYQLWMIYASKNEASYFDACLDSFVHLYSQFVDTQFTHLDEGFSELAPHLTKLPEGFLQCLSKSLSSKASQDCVDANVESFEAVVKLIKCLIIICRNPDNIDLVASYSCVSHLVTIATSIFNHPLTQSSLNQSEDGVPIEEDVDCQLQNGNLAQLFVSIMLHLVHFLECIYDPHFVWRKQLNGWTVDMLRLKHKPADLHVEVVPFIYECFQHTSLSTSVCISLLHLFGAIITGSQSNAIKAICPATMDVLLELLSSSHINQPISASGSQDQQISDDSVCVRNVILKCLVSMAHVTHSCSPEQRQVEVGHLFEGFFGVLKGMSDSGVLLDMINCLDQMLACQDVTSLLVIFVSSGGFDCLMTLLERTNLTGPDAQSVAMAVVRVIRSIQTGSLLTRKKFNEKIGYTQLVEALKRLGQPSQELLQVTLGLVTQGDCGNLLPGVVYNTHAALMLVQWLPDITSHEVQIWLAESLRKLCTSSNHNKMTCCKDGMIGGIVGALRRQKDISPLAVCQLISLLSSLGQLSITASEVKQVVAVMKLGENNEQMPYVSQLMHSLSVMAQNDSHTRAHNYFNLEKPTAGISLAGVRKWPGNSFAFHAWILLDYETSRPGNNDLYRRQLYSFYSSSTCGFEAFFTEEGVLVVATSVKKEFFTVSVSQNPIKDNKWHCVDIVHSSSRTPFKPSQVNVYIDGHLWLTSQLKFPSLTDPFTCCRIGCSGLILSPDTPPEGAVDSSPKKLPFKIPFTMPKLPGGSTLSAASISSGMQDSIWGAPSSLGGSVASVCIFHDVLQPNHVKHLFSLGPNCLNVFQEGDLSDLANKLVLHYNGKACLDQMCLDLSSHQNHGRLSGHQCVTSDVKHSINSVGGLRVLLPLLEYAQMTEPSVVDGMDSPRMSREASPDDDDWVFVAEDLLAGSEVPKNQVANFITVLRVMVERSPINQEIVIKTHTLATVGVLLQRVDPSLIDVSVLFAVQFFVDAVYPVNTTLLHAVYQYILFDFRIWSKTEFHVRIGHIQYLSTKLKDDKKYFRKKYGVQYMMDIIRQYYSAETDDKLCPDDCKAIRGAILCLVKYYVLKEIKAEEVKHVLHFVLTVRNQEVVCEVLDLLLFLLESRGSSDQIFLLMFEPGMAEVLYPLILPRETDFTVKERVLKVILLLLSSQKVYEKNKTRLHLLDIGLAGLTTLMSNNPISAAMVTSLLDQAMLTSDAFGLSSLLSVIQLIPSCDVSIKVATSRRILEALFKNPTAPRTVTKLIGWQQVLSQLLVLKPGSILGSSSSQQRITPADPPDTICSISEPDSVDEVCSSGSNTNQSLMPDSKVMFTLDTVDGDLTDYRSTEPVPVVMDEALFSTSPRRRVFTDSSLFDPNESLDLGLGFEDSKERSRSRSSTTSIEDVSAITSPSSVLKHRLDGDSSTDVSQTIEEGDGAESDMAQKINQALNKMGLSTQVSQDHGPERELMDNVLVALFTVMWRGVEGSGREMWMQRLQVFSAVSRLASGNQMVANEDEIGRRLLEMMTEACIADAKDSSQLTATYYENCYQLVKVIHHFIGDSFDSHNGNGDKHSEKLLESVLSLLDNLCVWQTETKWPEMALHGIGILLKFIGLSDINLCCVAAPRLHTLIETQPMTSSAETSYLLLAIDKILSMSSQSHHENYSFVIPVMRALIDRSTVILDIDRQLPNMPVTAGNPTFFDDFRKYSETEEWRNFILDKVKPQAEHFVFDNLTEYLAGMVNFWSECHESMMVDRHKRNREDGESKLKFQKQIMEPYVNLVKVEEKRYQDVVARQRHQHLSTLRQWRNVEQFFRSERGAWADCHAAELYWKLSNQENFSRMRPKLVQNCNFDLHTDASYQRDHGGLEAATSELPQLKIAAKVLQKDVDDDRLGEEEWSLINEAGQVTEEHSDKEKLVFAEECELVTIAVVVKGRLEVTTSHIYFFDCSSNRELGAGEDFRCSLSQLREIHFRRYNLRRSALEMFLVDQTSYFLNFHQKNRNKVYSQILRLRPANLIYYGSRSPAELLKASELTQKWVQREISNFDYLMQLNTIAGRTYNDLSQYPVFPWILCDYTSDTLDLDDPSVYRDLSKPMGVVNSKNEEEVREKYENFEDPSGMIEKFHYGTHYSNAAGVMHYMVRMEPFTSLHIKLQSGKFDVADRQFHSVASTWQGLMDNPNDVKELIPEFYYLPEFLENRNGFDLGCLHLSKTRISDVLLPNWAKSPEEFVYKHRKALESDHVSAHLHEWIDLIFGYKQKGPAAVDALNVFFYCTYEGAVDLDAISNPVERKALEGMINNFGQTPSQLLKEPHPRRMTFTEAVQKAERADKALSVFQFLSQLKAYFVEVSSEDDPAAYVVIPRNQSRSFIQHGMPDAMITVSVSGVLGIHKWLPYDKSISNYFTFERDPLLAGSKSKRVIAGPFAPGLPISANLFVCSHDAKLLFSGGHWDNSLRVYSMVKGRSVAHIVRHTDIVTCLALDYCGSHLITGSRDTTCMIWPISQHNGVSTTVQERPSHVLYGHDQEVSAVAISIELDIAVSASKDGTVNVHTVRKGLYTRTLHPVADDCPLAIPFLVISDMGHIVFNGQSLQNARDSHVFVYSVNGKCLSHEKQAYPVSHMLISDDYVILGDNQGTLYFKEIFGLKTITSMPLYVPIKCLSVTNGNSHIMVALKDGKLIIVGIKKTSEVKSKLYKAVMGTLPRQ